MMGTDVAEVGIGLEGHLEDMLLPDAADTEGMSHDGGFASRPGVCSQQYAARLIDTDKPTLWLVLHIISRRSLQCHTLTGYLVAI